MLTWSFLCDLISDPLQCATVASFPISFIFFWLPSLVRVRVPHDTGVFGSCVSCRVLYELPTCIRSHCMVWKSRKPFTVGGGGARLSISCQLATVMKSILSAVSSPSPIPQPWAMGSILRDPPLCTPFHLKPEFKLINARIYVYRLLLILLVDT